jgi:excisionase family DNA binding protein
MKLEEPRRLLTVREVAARLGQSEATIREKAKSGQLPAVKIAAGPRAPFRFDQYEIERWIYGVAGGSAMTSAIPAERDGTPPMAQSSPSRGAGSGAR